MLLELIALILAGIHFGIPLTYYLYLKSKYLNRPWNIKIDENYRPKVTIIIPTYREAKFIWERLDNLYAQKYPKRLIEVIIVDSKSDDRTIELAKEWASKHPDLNIRLIEEDRRYGKLHALQTALKEADQDSEVIVFTDADAIWEPNALSNALSYFADPSVGSVTGSISYVVPMNCGRYLENTYREFYNLIRVAESKKYATPIHNGPFLAIRTNLLRKIGLPYYAGSDDSAFGSLMAFSGYRAIQADNVIVREPIRGSQFRRKIRSAQHLFLSFLKTRKYAKRIKVYRYTRPFEEIWKIEWWLHVVNPWLLAVSTLLLIIEILLYESLTALALLGVGLIFLTLTTYRTWILQQIYLIIATIKNLWTKEVVWKK